MLTEGFFLDLELRLLAAILDLALGLRDDFFRLLLGVGQPELVENLQQNEREDGGQNGRDDDDGEGIIQSTRSFGVDGGSRSDLARTRREELRRNIASMRCGPREDTDQKARSYAW